MGSNHVTSVFMASILKTSDQDKNMLMSRVDYLEN